MLSVRRRRVLLLLWCPIAHLPIRACGCGALLRRLTVAGGRGTVGLLSTCSHGERVCLDKQT